MRAMLKNAPKRVVVAVGLMLQPLLSRFGIDVKQKYELAYWRRQARREGNLANAFYERLFTDAVGLTRETYSGKRILDIGCGPRGSLEWLDGSAIGVGIDPLIPAYAEFGIVRHRMRYAASAAEHLPFRSHSFDVVTSLNSLDHVDDLDGSLAEIGRVLKPGGLFVLLVEVHQTPTLAEPISVPWQLTASLRADFDVVVEHHFEESPKRRGSSAAAVARIPFDHSDPRIRSGTLLALLQRIRSGATEADTGMHRHNA